MLILNWRKRFNDADLCFLTRWAARDFKIHRHSEIVLHLPVAQTALVPLQRVEGTRGNHSLNFHHCHYQKTSLATGQ